MSTITTIIDSDLLLPILDLPVELRHRKVEITVQAPIPSEPEQEENKPWFAQEELAQFKQNRLKQEEKIAKNPPPMSQEEFSEFLLRCPVADEETIRMQDEIMEMRKRWTI